MTERKLRLRHIAPFYLPSTAAHGSQVFRMCHAFSREGCEVTLVAKRDPDGTEQFPDPFDRYGVPASFHFERFDVPRNRFTVRSAWFALRAVMLAPRPDAVFTRCLKSAIVAALRGIPSLFELHSGLRSSGSGGERMLRLGARLPAFRGVVVTNQALADDVLALVPTMAGKVHLERNAVFLETLADAPHEISADTALTVGYVGSLHEGKGAEILVPLARRLPDVRVRVVGGNEQDIAHWRGVAGDLPNLEFLGHQPQSRIPALVEQCDIMLAPYQSRVFVAGTKIGANAHVEGDADMAKWMSPLKIFEYLATGRPIIATRMPAIEEFLTDGENALLVDPDDLEAWATAVQRLAAEPALARKLAANGLRDAREKHTLEGRAQRIVRLLGLA